MKKNDALRRLISYRSLDALVEHFAKYKKTQTPENCIHMIAERDWVEGVEYCLQQIPEKHRLATCESLLETAAESNAVNVFKMIIESQSKPCFDSMIESAFRIAVGELSSKVVVYCLNSKLVTVSDAAKLLVGTVEAGEVGLQAFDEIIKVVPKDSQLMRQLLYQACERRNIGVVRRVFKLCEEHKITLLNDEIAEAIIHGVGMGSVNLEFIEGILKIPKAQQAVKKDGAMMILTAAMSNDTFAIQRLLDEGVVPNVHVIEYLANKVFDGSRKVGKLVYKKDDKRDYDRHCYQLSLVVPASKGAWRLVESKKAVRALIDYFGVDSPQGHDLTAKLFLM